MIIVADTSPLRYLVLIEAVDVLPRLFGNVLIPPAVDLELRHPLSPESVRVWIGAPPAWLTLEAPTTDDRSLDVDRGEREAILLAREKSAPLLIDDDKGKRAAVSRQIQVFGTLAVLVAAATRDMIDFPAAVERLTKTTNFRTPVTLVQTLLERDAARRRQRRSNPPNH